MNRKVLVTEQRIGIREFRARLSECVRDVKAGATVVVTEHARRAPSPVRTPIDASLASGPISLPRRHFAAGLVRPVPSASAG